MSLEQIKALVGDLARPFAIWATAATTAWAIIDPAVGTDKLTAAGFILCALYGAKVYENQVQTRKAADVEIAKATAPAETLKPPAEAAPAGSDTPPWVSP